MTVTGQIPRPPLGRTQWPLTLGGLWLCLALLTIEISLLAVTQNWLALSVTLAGLGGVVAATYLTGRPRERRRLRLR